MTAIPGLQTKRAKMTTEEFRKHLEDADRIVSTWPDWKRNILEKASKPTVDVPRRPVDNHCTSEAE